MTDEPPILIAQDLNMHLVFDNRVARVVDNVSLVVRKGEVLGIVGESGSGKSMIALSLLGLPPQPYGKIVRGRVAYRGIDLLNPSAARTVIGKRIGIVFENPGASLDPCYRIGDQITETIRSHEPCGKSVARTRAIELLTLVGIADPAAVFSSYPHQLSGGMQQRAGIAIALSCNPELLIADNPTSALDVTIQAQIMRLIDDLRRRLGLTVVWITNNMGVIAKACDHVAVIYAGQIVEYGQVSQVLRSPRHPYTQALLHASPRIHDQQPLTPLGGNPPRFTELGTGCRFAARCPRVVAPCRTADVELRDIGARHDVRCIVASAEP
jgi:oligopeptide/dipeptide ABC transporter ATP-binding protein